MKFKLVFWILFLSAKNVLAFTYVGKVLGPYRPSTTTVGERSYEINAVVKQWNTSNYFDRDGQREAFEPGQSFVETDTDLSIDYGLKRRFDVFGQLKARHINSTTDELDASRFGVESIRGGARFGFPQQSHFNIAISGFYSYPLYSNPKYETFTEIPDNEISLGDGEAYINAGIHLSVRPTRRLFFVANAALNTYDGDQSQETVFLGEISWVKNLWAFRLGLEGLYSMNSDAYSNDLDNKPITGQQSTSRYNSINRSYQLPYIAVNRFLTKNASLTFRYGKTISGVSTDNGNEISLGFVYNAQRAKSDSDIKFGKFKQYDLEATVTKVSPRMRYIKIDRGITDDIEKGALFDVYSTDSIGENILIASGVVFQSKANFSIVKVIKVYRTTRIKRGFTVRRINN
jgi:hypothetical protein